MSYASIVGPGNVVLWEQGQPRKQKHSFAPMVNSAYVAPPQPARYTYPRARALKKLVLRTTASLDSTRCGWLWAGQSVLVLNDDDRTGRVRVGACLAEGMRPLGWVTKGKDGESFLQVVEEASRPGAQLNCSPRRVPWSAGSPRPQPTLAQEEQTAVRAANRRAMLQQARSAGPSGDKFLSRLGQAEQRDEQLSNRPKLSHRSHQIGGLLSAEELRQRAVEQLSLSPQSGSSEGFASKLGHALLSNGVNDDLLKHWDLNGNDKVSKVEFCVGIRKLLGVDKQQARVASSGKGAKRDTLKERAETEAIFDSIDVHHDGEVSLPMIMKTLSRLAARVKNADAGAARALEVQGARQRTVAAALNTAASETAALEVAESKGRALRHQATAGSLDVRLGALLRSRNMRVGDVIHDWDDDGDGGIDKKEFVHHIHALGLRDATVADCNALFEQLDEDHSGELDMTELRHALKNLLDAATAAETESKAQVKVIGERRQRARAAQQLALQVLERTGIQPQQQEQQPQQ